MHSRKYAKRVNQIRYLGILNCKIIVNDERCHQYVMISQSVLQYIGNDSKIRRSIAQQLF